MLPFTSLATTQDILNLWLVVICLIGGVLVPGISSAKDYWEAGLKKHNEYRAYHNVPLLELDTKLAEMADKCAQYYANQGFIDHSCPYEGGTGENLYTGHTRNVDEVSAVEQATKRWYDEIEDYDFNKNDAKDGKKFGDIGHFTQLTWKSSKRLGIGFAKAGDRLYVVAIYRPPGNYKGEYGENVFPRSGGGGGGGGGSSGQSSILIRGPKYRDATCWALSLLVISVGLISGQ